MKGTGVQLWFLLMLFWHGVGLIRFSPPPALWVRALYSMFAYLLFWWGILHFAELV